VDTAGRFCKRLAQDIAKGSRTRKPGLLLPQDPDDLLFSDPGSLHPSVPFLGRTQIVSGGVSGGTSEPSDLTRTSWSHSTSGLPERTKTFAAHSLFTGRPNLSGGPRRRAPFPRPNRPSNPTPRGVSTDGSGANRPAGSATWRNPSAQAGMSRGWVAVRVGFEPSIEFPLFRDAALAIKANPRGDPATWRECVEVRGCRDAS